MCKLEIKVVGKVKIDNDRTFILIDKKYSDALIGLDEYSHLSVLWWFSKCDNDKDRNLLMFKKPYKKGPNVMGMFALRQPQRPNPIAVSTAKIIKIDVENACVELEYIDAEDGSPVVDLKPYVPALDSVKENVIPDWCKHWPDCYEKALDYNWRNEFTFY